MSDDVVKPFAASPAFREAALRGDREKLRRLRREAIRKAFIDLAAPAIAEELGVSKERVVALLETGGAERGLRSAGDRDCPPPPP